MVTDQEIDALPAGPEMDRAVAEAMGYEVEYLSDGSIVRIVNDKTGKWCHWFSPSTDTGVMLAALERWAETTDGLFTILRCEPRGSFRYVIAAWIPEHNIHIGNADTLALAGCRALLRAEAGRK